MKTLFIKIVAIPLLLSLMSAGCKKTSESISVLEISPQSGSALIQDTSDSIDFEFCLMNEDGLPATIFNLNENLTFSFSFKNNYRDTIIITTEFINDNFFRVFLSQNNFDMGKPWTGVWCNYSLQPEEIVLAPSKYTKLTCPWIRTVNNVPVYPLCMSESKDPLGQGEYYTSVDLNFHYSKDGKKSLINNIKLKINFKIL